VAQSIQEFIGELGDPRIRFHQQEENVGEYGQGRFFFSEAKSSRYFMILHDDDLLGDNYLEKAVARLDKSKDCAYFVADADIIDEQGKQNAAEQKRFLKDHSRTSAVQGEFPVLEYHLKYGFNLISGALFRTDMLKASGFVSEDGVGNYPFESDIFLRLGDLKAKAWYQKENLLSFRFHTGSMRHYIKLMDNEKVVNAMVRLFACRNYTGYAERQRKVTLGRLYRAKALIAVRQGNVGECRKNTLMCFKYNVLSLKLWLIAPVALFVPRVLSWFLPTLPTALEAPNLRRSK